MPLAPKFNIDDDASTMVRVGFYDNEFPLLKSNGLYAAQTTGDGDCLFHSLSDQLYGHEDFHHELRQRVVEHLRSHSQYFKSFIDVAPVRRAPRRRAAATSKADLELHSQAEIDRAFEHRLQRMQNSGVFGDNLEIQAFAREFGVDVKIYLREYAYVIKADNGGSSNTQENDNPPVVHIAYHIWEHYSSIRNRNGPHTGPPLICVRPPSPTTAQAARDDLDQAPVVLPWMEEVVSAALPHFESSKKIRSALRVSKGDVNDAVCRLIKGFDDEPNPELESSDLGNEAVSNTQSMPDATELVEDPKSAAEHLPLVPINKEIEFAAMGPEYTQSTSGPENGELEIESPAKSSLEEPIPEVPKPEPLELQEPVVSGVITSVETSASPVTKPASEFAELLDADDEEYSRVKRRKSPDGTPVNISMSSINDDASSVASSFSSCSDSSGQSSSSSESDVSFTETRRRKPANSTFTNSQPARRSTRLRARTGSTLEQTPKSPTSTAPPPPSIPRTVPRRKPKVSARVRTVTVGIRELYV